MDEKTLKEFTAIRNRSKEVDRVITGEKEAVTLGLFSMILPVIPQVAREHMANSIHDTKVLLTAYDESQTNFYKLAKEVNTLKAELAQHKAAKNPCGKCLCSLCSDPCSKCTGCEHNKAKLSVIVTWMDGSELEYEAYSVEVDKAIHSLVLGGGTRDVVIPLHKIRHYTIGDK